MATINPYLNFNGKAEEAFTLYKSVFGGEFIMLQRYKDTPEANKMPAEIQDKIMHIALPVGQGNILMASDALDSMGQRLTVGNNISISISAASKEEADRLFTGLSAGGQVTMPLDTAFWGDYFGMLTDKFGIHWMVSFNENQKQ